MPLPADPPSRATAETDTAVPVRPAPKGRRRPAVLVAAAVAGAAVLVAGVIVLVTTLGGSDEQPPPAPVAAAPKAAPVPPPAPAPSPVTATIGGPTEVRVGTAATYTVQASDMSRIAECTWTDPNGAVFDNCMDLTITFHDPGNWTVRLATRTTDGLSQSTSLTARAS